MTATALLERAARQGVTVEVCDGSLKLAGPSQSVETLLPEIRVAKPELLALLSGAEPPPISPADHEAIREAIAERAAIREIDGGEDRATAEREAAAGMRIYQYRIADKPDTWLTMLAPGCDLDDARHSLMLRFGADRLIDVRERTSPAAPQATTTERPAQ
jgi:hypothetical protein